MIAQFKLSRMRRWKGLNRMVPGFIASVVVLALMQMNAWTGLERQINTQMMLWRGQVAWDSRIVMVSVDDKTLKEYGPFPITRDAYADLLWVLKREQASVVAFNVSFSDTSELNRTFKGEAINPSSRSAENTNLASAIQSHGRVVLGQSWDENGNSEVPVPVLANTAIAIGHLQLAGSDSDGLTRRVEVAYQDMPALGVAATQAYLLNKTPLRMPSEKDYLTINWPASGRDLATLSLLDVQRGNFPDGFFTDKIVIVSYGAFAGPVEIETPFDQRPPITNGQLAGGQSLAEPRSYQRGSVQSGYLHAAVIHNLLQQNWLRPIPDQLLVVYVLLVGPAFSGLLYRRSTLTRLLLCVGIFGGWLLLCMLVLYVNYQLLVVVPLATLTSVGAAVSILGRLESNALLQVRSAFLNTMSHEIRTPLNAIVNLSEMLQETELDERQREFAETLNTSSHALLALINDVLDFSKIESGRLMIDECPVQLSETVERSLEMLAPRAAEKGLELVYSITPSTPAVIMSDPVRLQQILLNLLSNAVKFTEVGEVSVQVQATPMPKSRTLLPWQRLSSIRERTAQFKRINPRWNDDSRSLLRLNQAERRPVDLYEIRFAVHDTGIGIPSERMSQLFKPFSQVSAATTRKYGGTGLGLSISKRLSERMGGDLWVRSYPGEGSTFYFTVQASVAKADAAVPSYLTALGGTRLLLIDRNITRSNHFTWQLQPLGISLAQATSLSEALSFMQNDPMFDGIVLDEAVAKTQEECAFTIQTLRRTARNEHLPVILLSTLQTAQPPPELCADTVTLWKPVKQAALYQALQSISPTTLPTLPMPASSLLYSTDHSSIRFNGRTNGRTNGDVPALTNGTTSLSPRDSESSPTAIAPAVGSARDEVAVHDVAAHDVTANSVTSNGVAEGDTADAEAVAEKARRARLSILIAEDNRTNQRVALRLLELLGFRADVADTGLAALSALKRQHYDVILMDMRMPEMDGIETTHKIRQMPQYSEIWIIAMTANAMTRDRQMCFAAGMDDYLSKPINRAALDRALLRCPAMQAQGAACDDSLDESP
ncbi:MAG: CHASE2 domain-containing protein [Phormidesmis sp.]